MRSSGITVYTETSSDFIPSILHEEIQEILPVLILHSEDKELFDSFYIQKARRSSIQSTKTYKAFQFYKDIPALQALLQIPAFLQSECKFYTRLVSTRNSIECQSNTRHSTDITFFKEREMLRYRSYV